MDKGKDHGRKNQRIQDRNAPYAMLANNAHHATKPRVKLNKQYLQSPADGAAALLLASEEAVKTHDLSPLVKIAAWTSVGVDPIDTGIAAAVAVKKLLHEHKLNVEDVDLFEVSRSIGICER